MSDTKVSLNIDEVHWQLGLLQNLDVGLVVLDQSYQVHLWNSFMANHSGIGSAKIHEKNLFDSFPELPQAWLRRKLDTVFKLNIPAYITWEQRPHLFEFNSPRPITGVASTMYQNITLIPLTSPTGEVEFVGMMVYDVTDTAVNHLALADANAKLQTLSREDGLTGLFNRGYWQECLEREFHRFMRSHEACSLIMLDIDHFKNINDTYGHGVGDRVIKSLALFLRQRLRKSDTIGRYGGKEFAVILPDTLPKNAKKIFKEILSKFREINHVAGDEAVHVTFSCGIAEATQVGDGKITKCADEALYEAKAAGRNQVTVYHGDGE